MNFTEKQLYNLQTDLENINGINQVDIEEDNVSGSGGYWCDREGRHPWVEFELKIDLSDLSYKIEGNCSSKAGDIDETSDRAGSCNKIEDLAEVIEGEISDICHEIDG